MSEDYLSRFAVQELWRDNRQEDLALAEQENWDLPTCKYVSSALRASSRLVEEAWNMRHFTSFSLSLARGLSSAC